MPIVDRFGHPIQPRDIEATQTSRVAHLPSRFGDHPSLGITPARMATILERAEHGDLVAQAELGEDMEEKDAHIYAELSKRRRALLGLDWRVDPPRGASRQEVRAAEMADEMLRDLDDLDDLLLDIGDAIGKGYSCLEIAWGRRGRLWWPEAISHRPASWFTTAADPDMLYLRDGSPEGAPLQPFGWITHVHKAKAGHVGRAGLLRILAWPFLFKVMSARDLAEFLEIYGLPLRLGTYPSGASEQEKSTLLKAVVGIGHAAAGIVPEGMRVDFKEAAKGSEGPFMAMIDWCERSQSKAILGATLTSQTDSGSGAMALGNVHNEVRHDLLVSDARQIERTLTRDLVYPLVALNIGGIEPHRSPRLVFDTREVEDLKLLSEALPRLVDMGMEIPRRWAHDRSGIPEPADGEPVLRAQTPGVAAARAASRVPPTGARDIADDYVDRLDAEAAPLMDGLIEPVRELVMSSASLEALRDGLIALAAEMPIDDLGTVMQRAFAAAELAGRYEADRGR